jgi:hypothetical protein
MHSMNASVQTPRFVENLITGRPTRDGAGVRLNSSNAWILS